MSAWNLIGDHTQVADRDRQRDAGQHHHPPGEQQRPVIGLRQARPLAQMGQHDAQHIQGVIHADADAQRDHRQRRHLHPHAQPDHQGFAQDRGQHQRQHRHQHRPPGAEGDPAQDDHRAINPQQHLAHRLVHDDVGRGLDPGVPGGQHEADVRAVVLGGEALHRRDDAGQRVGLVVLEIDVEGQERTALVEQLARGVILHGAERAVVGDQFIPFDVPLVVTDPGQLAETSHRVGRLHAGQLLQRPGQPVHRRQGGVAGATVGRRFHHHHEDVRTRRVIRHHEGAVAVVAGVGPQFRRAGVEVADLQIQADRVAADRQPRRNDDGRRRPAAPGEQIQRPPQPMTLRRRPARPSSG